MSDQKKKELQEVTEKLKKMDAKGIAIMNRDASTILMCQEVMQEADKDVG